MKHIHVHRLFATVSAVAVMSGAFGTTAAYAFPGDEKVFPGSMCIRTSGGTPSYSTSGKLLNTSSTVMTVVCPLVRDDVLHQWDVVQVTAIDQHVSQNIECRVRSASQDGNNFVETGRKTTSLNSASGQFIEFPTASEVDRGSFFVLCTIPAAQPTPSGIASYLIAEDS